MKKLSQLPLELIFWVAALIFLAVTAPVDHHHGDHLTLCPLANLGFDWCPGCGIGRSIGTLLRGDLKASLNYHWFGIPALGILCYRIVILAKLSVVQKFKLI